MMKHLFLSYELGKLAKEKGFDEPVLGFFDNNHFNNDIPVHRLFPSVQDVSAMSESENADILFIEYDEDDTVFIDYKAMDDEVPAITPQQILDWFEHKHKIFIMSYPRDGWCYLIQRIDETISCDGESKHGEKFKTKTECLEKAIKEAFKLI